MKNVFWALTILHIFLGLGRWFDSRFVPAVLAAQPVNPASGRGGDVAEEAQHRDNVKSTFRSDYEDYDRNKDGSLDAAELRESISGLRATDVVKFFYDLDVNDDGQVSFDEYITYASSTV
eukprot:Filipodium_phascolosomae@DN228_c0_g1_i1.p1